MKRDEMIAKMNKEIVDRKQFIIKGVESELKYLEKYLSELKEAENSADVLNAARNVNSYAGELASKVERECRSMENIRLGIYYLSCIEE